MTPRKAAKKYVRYRIELIKCRQNHFKQLCQRCIKWGTCKVYGNYVQAWIDLQESL